MGVQYKEWVCSIKRLLCCWAQIKNEFPQIISMYDLSESGTVLMHEIHPGEVYNPPLSFFASRNPLKLGIGYVQHTYA